LIFMFGPDVAGVVWKMLLLCELAARTCSIAWQPWSPACTSTPQLCDWLRSMILAGWGSDAALLVFWSGLVQAFLEAVYTFVQGMPLADLWQDQTWQEHVALLQGTAAADAAVAGPGPGALGSAPSGPLLPSAATAAVAARRITVASAGAGRSTLELLELISI